MKITTEIFIERAIAIHGESKFNYSDTVYVNSKTKVSIYCNTHAMQFEQRPENHVNGAGCKKCRYEKIAKKNSAHFKSTADEFIQKAKSIHGDKYDYSKVVYELAGIPVTIVCPTHGEFSQRPNDHIKGKGCRECCAFGFQKDKAGMLYYLSINNGEAFKIGITNRTVNDRFNNTDLAKIAVLKTWDYPIGRDAYEKEQEILALYKDSKYIGSDLLTDGNTELFSEDVLGLA